MRPTVIFVCVGLTCVSACKQRKFQIEMQLLPNGAVLRKITVWAEDDGKPATLTDKDLAPLREAYGEPIRADGGRYSFSKEFVGKLPADIGQDGTCNFGAVAVRRSLMGRTVSYLERLPGLSNPSDVVRQGTRSIDLLVKALTAYVQRHPEVAGSPERLERLTRFLDVELRRDASDALLLVWFPIAAEPGETVAETGSASENDRIIRHAGTLLVERGYLAPGDPTLVEDVVPLLRGVIRKAVAAMGYQSGEPLPPALVRLVSLQPFHDALDEGLSAIGSSTDELTRVFRSAQPSQLSPEGLISGTILWHSAAKPAETNGKWDDAARSARWDAEGRSALQLPQILMATWAEPDEAFQQQHFGKIVLRSGLEFYNVWYASLSYAEAIRWDAFLDTLVPGPELDSKLASFRFEPAPATRSADRPSPPDRAEYATRRIREGLKLAD